MLSLFEFVSASTTLVIILWLLYFLIFGRDRTNSYDRKLIRRVLGYYMALVTAFLLIAISTGAYV